LLKTNSVRKSNLDEKRLASNRGETFGSAAERGSTVTISENRFLDQSGGPITHAINLHIHAAIFGKLWQ
jgi:hypothetical protein